MDDFLLCAHMSLKYITFQIFPEWQSHTVLRPTQRSHSQYYLMIHHFFYTLLCTLVQRQCSPDTGIPVYTFRKTHYLKILSPTKEVPIHSYVKHNIVSIVSKQYYKVGTIINCKPAINLSMIQYTASIFKIYPYAQCLSNI